MTEIIFIVLKTLPILWITLKFATSNSKLGKR